MKKILNVGGGTNRELPSEYNGWKQDVLDIDPDVGAEICCDARIMNVVVEPKSYDAVYCSHNLEHYYKHEVSSLLKQFKNVLNDTGFVDIYVPNLVELIEQVKTGNLDIDDVWYRVSTGAPVTFHDVLYGWNVAMSQGNLYYAHKCGFTPLSLHKELCNAGFTDVKVFALGPNIRAVAKG